MRHVIFCSLFAVLGFVGAGIVAFVLAALICDYMNVSDFEGASGFAAVGIGIGGAVSGAIGGLILGFVVATKRSQSRQSD